MVALFAGGALAAPEGTGKDTPASQPASRPAGEQSKISPLQAAILGVVEGLTEYLPVSSTGHLILASHAMGLSHFTDQQGLMGPKLEKAPAIDAFEIIIQFGAILAVAGLYRRQVGQMCLGVVGRSKDGLRLLMLLVVATLPATVVGLRYHKAIKENLFGPMPVCYALIMGGILMIVVEYFWRRRKNPPASGTVYQVMFWQALAIGVAQVLSLWPGTSRSMVTILAGLIVGLDMVAAAEFSFLLALPVLTGATLVELAKGWRELFQSAGPVGLVIGLVVSAVVAALAIRGFVRWLTHHGMMPFGVYRILFGAAIFVYFMMA